jgi:ABC-type uncharacterized transport system involved in gliding motility auxiliary subunit
MKKEILTSAAGVALVAGIFAAANLLGAFLPVRLDISRGGIYSLSSASRKLVTGLEDPVLAQAYFSKTLPPQYEANRRYLESFLKEYAAQSKGKFRYEFIDVDGEKGEQAKREAMADGITPVRFNTYSRERLEVREGMMGLTMRYEDQKEVLPLVADIASLEYDITSRIRKMALKKKPVLAFATGVGSAAPGDLPEKAAAQLQERYELRPVDLSKTKDELPSDIGALCLIGPSERLNASETALLDKFVDSGRPLLVAVDTRKTDLHTFSSNSQETGVPSWLSKYGIVVRPEMVLDQQNQRVSVTSQQGYFQMVNIVEYPPMVLSTDLNRSQPATKDIEALLLPFSSPIESSSGSPLKETALAKSTPNSWIHPGQKGFASLNPYQEFKKESADPSGPFTLAAAFEGRLPGGLKDARLVVVGTSKFIRSDQPLLPVNQAFFLNLVDWMLQEPELIAIRSKAVAFTPLKNIPDGRKALVRYANIFGPGLLVVGLGGLRWRSRSRFKLSRARTYGL